MTYKWSSCFDDVFLLLGGQNVMVYPDLGRQVGYFFLHGAQFVVRVRRRQSPVAFQLAHIFGWLQTVKKKTSYFLHLPPLRVELDPKTKLLCRVIHEI